MSDCPIKLATLECDQSGVGWLACDWLTNATTVKLKEGQGANFPLAEDGRTFWVDIGTSDCMCCVRAEVIDRHQDTLTLRAQPPHGGCAVIPCGARVSYASGSLEHALAVASSVGINAVPPLRYDCNARRLWIDCEALRDMLERPCGT